MRCIQCGSTRIRISKFRRTDFFHLLSLQFPVRCRTCFERKYVRLPLALGILRTQKIRRRQAQRTTGSLGRSTSGKV